MAYAQKYKHRRITVAIMKVVLYQRDLSCMLAHYKGVQQQIEDNQVARTICHWVKTGLSSELAKDSANGSHTHTLSDVGPA